MDIRMDLRSNAFLQKLLEQLDATADDTLALFRQTRLRSRSTDENGQRTKVSALHLSSDQRAAAASINAKYEIWALKTASLLGKYSPSLETRFSEVVSTTSSYLLFQRVGSDLSSKKWRDLFVSEFSAIVAMQRDLLLRANEEYLFHKPHFWCFKNHQPCNVSIRYDPRSAFVLMPFADRFRDVYEIGLKPTLEHFGFSCVRADEILHSREIICRSVCQPIQEANLVIAELTGQNPNVYYELGLCHGFEKDIVMLVQNIEDVPFDLRAMNIITYSRVAELIEKLRAHLVALTGKVA
jgi:hypothetical protein